MSFTDLTICNLAIDRVSGDRIDELGEDSPLGAFCRDNYPHKRDFVLGKYRWTFANQVTLLARLAVPEGEPMPCAFKYARPADLAGAVHDWREVADKQKARISPYVMDSGGAFWSDQSPLFAEYTRHVPEAQWPSWFRQLVVTAFAADLADFCQLRGQARDLRMEAWGTPSMDGEGGLYAQARNEDARHAPQRQLAGGVDGGPLVEARMGGGFSRFGFSGFSLANGAEMAEVLRQSNFNGGELSPKAIGRRDLKAYASSVALSVNMVTTAEGPLRRRGGFRHLDMIRRQLTSVPLTGAVLTAPNGGDASKVLGGGGMETTTPIGATDGYVVLEIDFGAPTEVAMIDLIDFIAMAPSSGGGGGGGGGDLDPLPPPTPPQFPWRPIYEYER